MSKYFILTLFHYFMCSYAMNLIIYMLISIIYHHLSQPATQFLPVNLTNSHSNVNKLDAYTYPLIPEF